MIYTVSKVRNDGAGYALAEKLNVKMPIVFVSLSEDLDFNEAVLELAGKSYCLISYVELGWGWDRKLGHRFGVNTQDFPKVFHWDKWKVFDDFVRDNPPLISFYRELLQEQVTGKILPISYPCFVPQQRVHTFEEFNNRIFEVFYSFGISHEFRKNIHANIWTGSSKYGYTVADNLYLLEHFIANDSNPHKWASIHIPWWSRQPMEVITERMMSGKIGISPAGAGRCCFRHLETPAVSAMIMWDDNTAWHQKDWIHGENCIKCEQGTEVETAIEWLKHPDRLYKIYLNGMQTVQKFRFENYVPFLENVINKA